MDSDDEDSSSKHNHTLKDGQYCTNSYLSPHLVLWDAGV